MPSVEQIVFSSSHCRNLYFCSFSFSQFHFLKKNVLQFHDLLGLGVGNEANVRKKARSTLDLTRPPGVC